MATVVTDYDKKKLTIFNNWYAQGSDTLRKALDVDEKYTGIAKKKEALKLYEKALNEFQCGLRSVPKKVPVNDMDTVSQRVRAIRSHMDGANERIKVLNDIVNPVVEQPDSAANYVGNLRNATATEASRTAKKTGIAALFATQAEQEILGCIVESTGTRLSDIVGNDAAKQALDESVILPALNPSLFTGLRTPAKGILLFGPPGNGKTMLARAVATEARCTFFNISAATIMSKWVGEGEKMVKELFRIARDRQPSIIFIDEIDSMLCARGTDENGASRRVKTEFLLQFDGVTSTSEDRILVLGATNRPSELDDGVLRRFPRRIFIDLPNETARSHAIRSNFDITKTAFRLTPTQLLQIVDKTVGYSFSDLTALCREAAMGPVRGLPRSQLERTSARQIRPVTYEDVMKALVVIRPSTNMSNQEKLLEFARDFAQT